MEDAYATRPTLLLRIRDPQDAVAWKQFVDIYSPVLHRFGLKHGLQDADAADLTQDTLRAVHQAIGRLNYDPQVGKFRSWLFTVARSKLSNWLSGRRRHAQGTGDTAMLQLLDSVPAQEDEIFWDYEYERRLFHWAAEQVRGQFQESSWRAFWLTTVENRDAADVAAELGLSVGAIYIAKSRVLARLREKIRELGEP